MQDRRIQSSQPGKDTVGLGNGVAVGAEVFRNRLFVTRRLPMVTLTRRSAAAAITLVRRRCVGGAVGTRVGSFTFTALDSFSQLENTRLFACAHDDPSASLLALGCEPKGRAG